MSPTEFELRAALRDGEGDRPDAGAVIRTARARRQRRVRIAGGLSAAAVVAGVATGGGLLLSSAGTDATGSSAGYNADRGGALGSGAGAPGAAGGRSVPAGGPRTVQRVPPVGCIAHVPRLMLPGGGGSGQFGSTDDVLPPSTSTVVICSYGLVDSPSAPVRTEVTGADAQALVSSLNAAPAMRPAVCPTFRTLNTRQYVLTGVDASGLSSKPVVLTLADNPCQTQATNGTAVRYGWTPPASLAIVLHATAPAGGASTVPQVGPTGKPLPEPSRS